MRAFAPQSGVVRGSPRQQAKPASKPTTVKAARSVEATEDLIGVVLHFNTFTGVRDLGPALTAAAGFAEARVTVRPGAFDWQLKKCITGNVSHAVRFQFSHIAETKCASTISGTLKLWASRESLFFGITGSTHDGASSIRWAKTFDHLQKVSAAFHYREFNVIRGDHPGANVIEVTRGEITEISLVETAAFPNTSISFI